MDCKIVLARYTKTCYTTIMTYYSEHKEMCYKRIRKWQKENPERLLVYTMRYLRAYPWRKHLYNAKQRCNNPHDPKYKYYGGKGIRCLLTAKHIEYLWFRDNAKQLSQPSLDRRDSTKDYNYDNCRFIEMADNRTRRYKM